MRGADTRTLRVDLLPPSARRSVSQTRTASTSSRQHRQHQLVRNVGGLAVVLDDERPDDLGLALLAVTVEHEVLAADQPPAADQKHLDARVRPLVVDADDVLVGHRRVHDLLLGDDPLGGADAVAQVGRAFELERLGGLLHVVAHVGQDAVGLAVQKVDHLIDDLPIVLVVDRADARRGTALDVVVQTRARVVAGDHPRCTECAGRAD